MSEYSACVCTRRRPRHLCWWVTNTDNLECTFYSFKKGGGWFKLIRDLRWDALGPAMEKPENEDDTSGLKAEENENEYQEGRVWRVQAHAKNSISCIKVDPVNGSGVSRPHTQIIAWPFDFYLTRRKIAFFYCI